MALCLVPFAGSVLAEHGSSRFAFAIPGRSTVSRCVSVWNPATVHAWTAAPAPGLRRNMIVSPSLVGMIFIMCALLALTGLIRVAHWSLIMILPVTVMLGSRVRTLASE